MAIYDLGLPDGRILTLEAPDEQAALSAAAQWHQANPKPDTATDVGKGAVSGLAQGAVNLAGLPGISIPCGFTNDLKPLPIGLQLLGPAFSEEKLLRIARMYEAATDWHTRRAAL